MAIDGLLDWSEALIGRGGWSEVDLELEQMSRIFAFRYHQR